MRYRTIGRADIPPRPAAACEPCWLVALPHHGLQTGNARRLKDQVMEEGLKTSPRVLHGGFWSTYFNDMFFT